MTQNTCIQCGSTYDPSEKFCPRDDTPLTPMVECKRCRTPLRPDAPFCAHCRGAKTSAARTVRGRRMVFAAGASILVLVAIAGLRYGASLGREARDRIGSVLAALGPSSPARFENPRSAAYDFTLHQPSLLGDALGAAGASVSAAPPARTPVRPRAAPRLHHASGSPLPRAAAAAPVVRRVALHVPRPMEDAWERDADLEGELARLGMAEVRVMRRGRALRLSGSVPNDGALRTLYGLIYQKGYGEVSYEVEVR